MTTIEDVMVAADWYADESTRGGYYGMRRDELRKAIEQYAAERVAEMQADFDRTCLDLQNYAERLTAERDSLSLAYKTSEDDVFNLTQKVIPNLRAERDALQADAARYRWLRDMDEDPVCSLAAMWTDCKGSARSISKRVDAVVDAARGKNTT